MQGDVREAGELLAARRADVDYAGVVWVRAWRVMQGKPQEAAAAELGGMNSLLQIETSPAITLVSKVPTIILGMDVSHGSPRHYDIPSIAAVVSSRGWHLISKYRASVRTQSPKMEMIDSLFKPREAEDGDLIRGCLIDFYTSSRKRKPDQVIIFRDGVSESQFNQVLNTELQQIIEACKFLDEKWNPNFTLIIAQKNHHTKFFSFLESQIMFHLELLSTTKCAIQRTLISTCVRMLE